MHHKEAEIVNAESKWPLWLKKLLLKGVRLLGDSGLLPHLTMVAVLKDQKFLFRAREKSGQIRSCYAAGDFDAVLGRLMEISESDDGKNVQVYEVWMHMYQVLPRHKDKQDVVH